MKRWLTKNNLIYLISAVLALHMLTGPFSIKPSLADKGPTWLGLDESWQMAMNFVLKTKMVFGENVVFNYGPLGFLSYRYGWGISSWAFLCFDAFICVNFFFVFKDFILNAKYTIIGVLTIINSSKTMLILRAYYQQMIA